MWFVSVLTRIVRATDESEIEGKVGERASAELKKVVRWAAALLIIFRIFDLFSATLFPEGTIRNM